MFGTILAIFKVLSGKPGKAWKNLEKERERIMKTLKTYKFKELSKSAQDRAASEYIAGWEETHENGDLDEESAMEILIENEDDTYNKDGELL